MSGCSGAEEPGEVTIYQVWQYLHHQLFSNSLVALLSSVQLENP